MNGTSKDQLRSAWNTFLLRAQLISRRFNSESHTVRPSYQPTHLGRISGWRDRYSVRFGITRRSLSVAAGASALATVVAGPIISHDALVRAFGESDVAAQTADHTRHIPSDKKSDDSPVVTGISPTDPLFAAQPSPRTRTVDTHHSFTVQLRSEKGSDTPPLDDIRSLLTLIDKVNDTATIDGVAIESSASDDYGTAAHSLGVPNIQNGDIAQGRNVNATNALTYGAVVGGIDLGTVTSTSHEQILDPDQVQWLTDAAVRYGYVDVDALLDERDLHPDALAPEVSQWLDVHMPRGSAVTVSYTQHEQVVEPAYETTLRTTTTAPTTTTTIPVSDASITPARPVTHDTKNSPNIPWSLVAVPMIVPALIDIRKKRTLEPGKYAPLSVFEGNDTVGRFSLSDSRTSWIESPKYRHLLGLAQDDDRFSIERLHVTRAGLPLDHDPVYVAYVGAQPSDAQREFVMTNMLRAAQLHGADLARLGSMFAFFPSTLDRAVPSLGLDTVAPRGTLGKVTPLSGLVEMVVPRRATGHNGVPGRHHAQRVFTELVLANDSLTFGKIPGPTWESNVQHDRTMAHLLEFSGRTADPDLGIMLTNAGRIRTRASHITGIAPVSQTVTSRSAGLSAEAPSR